MQIISAFLTMAFQSVGQIMVVLFGWIVAAYFGKVPARQKYLFSAMGGVSLIWAAMALSITSPWLRQLLIATTTNQMLPFYIRFIIPLAGIGWILLPLVNGVLAIYYKHELDKPKVTVGGVLRGYKYTPGFALAMLLMLISLPLLILPPILQGWRREHLTIMIEASHFSDVLESVVAALNQRGSAVKLKDRRLLWRSPQALLSLFAHDLFGDWTKSRARIIKGERFQVVVHPTDLVIEGNPMEVIRTRNILAKELTFSEAFFTWEGDAHRVETAINLVRERLLLGDKNITEQLKNVENQLDQVQISFPEWEILYRQILQLRVRHLLTTKATLVTYPESGCKYYQRTPENGRGDA